MHKKGTMKTYREVWKSLGNCTAGCSCCTSMHSIHGDINKKKIYSWHWVANLKMIMVSWLFTTLNITPLHEVNMAIKRHWKYGYNKNIKFYKVHSMNLLRKIKWYSKRGEITPETPWWQRIQLILYITQAFHQHHVAYHQGPSCRSTPLEYHC